MGMDLGRGSGGRAPFLVVGLLFICIVLVFNWWSLSTQNLELYRQLADRGEHIKIGSRKIIECTQDREVLVNALEQEKKSKSDMFVRNVNLDHQLRKSREDQLHASELYSQCNVELESLKKLRPSQNALIELRRVEKEQLDSELKDKKAEITKLQAQLKEVQEKLDQKSVQPKEAPAAAVDDDTNPANHERRNAVDALAAADVNNAREQTDDTEPRDVDNNVDPREKEQEREANDKNTIDGAAQSS